MTAMGKIKKNLVADPNRGKKAERFLEESDLQKIFDPDAFFAWAKEFPIAGGAPSRHFIAARV